MRGSVSGAVVSLRPWADVANGVDLPRSWFDQLLTEYVTAVQLHMETEEKEFFPRAADHLTDEDWYEIDAMIDKIKGMRISKTIVETRLWLGAPGPTASAPE